MWIPPAVNRPRRRHTVRHRNGPAARTSCGSTSPGTPPAQRNQIRNGGFQGHVRRPHQPRHQPPGLVHREPLTHRLLRAAHLRSEESDTAARKPGGVVADPGITAAAGGCAAQRYDVHGEHSPPHQECKGREILAAASVWAAVMEGLPQGLMAGRCAPVWPSLVWSAETLAEYPTLQSPGADDAYKTCLRKLRVRSRTGAPKNASGGASSIISP